MELIFAYYYVDYIYNNWPPFIWVPAHFEFDLDIERYLLENDIISFERLVNTDTLPKEFMFHWVPLKIRNWDGSPVRAYAIINE